MPQPFALPLANHMLALLIAAAVLPLVFGVLARVFFFRSDVDDPRHGPRGARSEQAVEGGALPSPEPEPRYESPWSSLGTSAEASRGEPASGVTAADGRMMTFKIGVVDPQTFAAQLQAVWREVLARVLAERERYHWPEGYEPASAPYYWTLELEPQGGAMTLTVATFDNAFGNDLMRLWAAEVWPVLEERLRGVLRPGPR